MTRKNQIERQRRIDTKVSQYLGQCPQEIAKYYPSRRQQIRFIKTPLTEKFGLLKEELKQNEVYYEEIEKAISSSCFCKKLGEINQWPPKDNAEISPCPPSSKETSLPEANQEKYKLKSYPAYS